MTRLHGLMLAFLAVTAAGPAVAADYCCKTNPAICQAICGARCCGDTNKLSAGAPKMTPIDTAELQSELRAAQGTASDTFIRTLRAEIATRDAAAPAKVKAK